MTAKQHAHDHEHDTMTPAELAAESGDLLEQSEEHPAGDMATATITTAAVSFEEPSRSVSVRSRDSMTMLAQALEVNIFEEGEILNGVYKIGELLGRGGMGQVFAAVDCRTGRDVAIKACWPRYGRAVLRAEAHALAAVHHPGVVAICAMGTHNGVDYLVMERLHGKTLHEHIRERKSVNPFSVDEAIDILIQIADALATIHKTGLVHRDIKPANIMLTHAGRTVLLDFGVAFRGDHAETEDRLIGSPHYIAPECITATMARGQAHLIDIYALGIIAFEMLVGRRPFEHNNTASILELHRCATPPRVADHVSGIPAALDRLISEMISKQPGERPMSAADVAARLRGLRHSRKRGQGVLASCQASNGEQPRMRCQIVG